MDIGRKRHRSCAVEDLFPYAVEVESYYPIARIEDLFALSFELAVDEGKSSAGLNFLTRAYDTLPSDVIDPL